ncbi:hypothetical protein [Nostoc sp. MS1]|uniref:hypothetical protein n=1 Tax=Nostoc sp. MS1 TaxID=2764711 RepID=UPI001CC6DC7B|nr:hypothetical protein [Nostoc sp. MS1]BCL40017.1 hypothetical protein NSMS1_64640 [Nostoc sp. MS1]
MDTPQDFSFLDSKKYLEFNPYNQMKANLVKKAMSLNCNVESIPIEDIAAILADDEDLIMLLNEQNQWSSTLCSKLSYILQHRTTQLLD